MTKEKTEKVKKAVVVERLELTEFDPTVSQLNAMVEATSSIVATDLKDKDQLAIVKENRIALMRARTSIEKFGKAMRDKATQFSRKVIEKEDELIAIIEPEEKRLAAIEEEAKLLAIREDRLEKLPIRKERLEAIDPDGERGEILFASDEKLLGMDSEQFESFYNQCVAEHNERVKQENIKKQQSEEARLEKERKEAQEKIDIERKKLDDERAALEAEKLKEQHAKEVREAAERAKIETEEKSKKEAADKEAKRIADEKAAEEVKKKEAALLAKREDYIKFLAEHGYTNATKKDFKVEETESGYTLFKKVGEFKK